MDNESNDILAAALSRMGARMAAKHKRMSESERIEQSVLSLTDAVWRYIAHARRAWEEARVPYLPGHLIDDVMDRVVGANVLPGLSDVVVRGIVRQRMGAIWKQMELSMGPSPMRLGVERTDIVPRKTRSRRSQAGGSLQ